MKRWSTKRNGTASLRHALPKLRSEIRGSDKRFSAFFSRAKALRGVRRRHNGFRAGCGSSEKKSDWLRSVIGLNIGQILGGRPVRRDADDCGWGNERNFGGRDQRRARALRGGARTSE